MGDKPLPKSDKERLLDEKIRAMREKNAMVEQRKLEVDKDKQLAESSRSSITSVSRSKLETDLPHSPSGDKKLKARLRVRQEEPQETTTGQRREHAHASSSSSRWGAGRSVGDSSDGPPPDPGYRFLADRMREREDDDDERRQRPPQQRRGGSSGASRATTARGNPGRNEDRQFIRKDSEEDEIVIVLEKDKHGRVQNHLSPPGSRTEKRRSQTVLGNSERKSVTSNKSLSATRPVHHSNIKSLFELNDKDISEYTTKERWKDDAPTGISSSRKIESQGSSLTITRNIENPDPPTTPRGSVSLKVQQSKAPESRPSKDSHAHIYSSSSSEDEQVVVSEKNWKCSDPSCHVVNPSGTANCTKCKLAFAKSRDYRESFACDKYRNEFNSSKPKATQSIPPPPFTNNANPSLAQPVFHPPEHGMVDWAQEAAATASPAAVDMVSYGQDWNSHMNPWALSQDLLMQQQHFNMMVNPMSAGGFAPPIVPNYYSGRPVAPTAAAQQYFSPAEYPVNPFPTGQPTLTSTFQQQQPPVSHFNPAAQSFVPTTDNHPGPVFQTPPPINTSNPPPPPFQTSRPPPPFQKNINPENNLLIPLKAPPKPVTFSRQPDQQQRKYFADKTSRGVVEESNLSSRLSEKNLHKTSSRPGRGKDTAAFKPPSFIEMQNVSLKKGSIPPPPANKGNGLLIFGTSNVVNNLDTVMLSNSLKIPVRLIPAMKFETFEKKALEVNPARDWLVLIHGLGNDARNIALRNKSESEKALEADSVANAFCDVIEQSILSVSSHVHVLISMLLPRCDFSERSGMSNPNNVRKVMNVQITSRLYEHTRVSLINSDTVLSLDDDDRRLELMDSDGYHLTGLGFKLMIENWCTILAKHINHKMSAKPTAATARGSVNEATAATMAAAAEVDDADIKRADVGETVPDPFGAYTAAETVQPTNPLLPDGADVALGSDNEDWDDLSIPGLETVEKVAVKTPVVPARPALQFRLGPTSEHQHMNGDNNGGEDGFIEDDYFGGGERETERLPSINLPQGEPESLQVDPVSGHFMEDSYLPQTMDNLAISRPSNIGDEDEENLPNNGVSRQRALNPEIDEDLKRSLVETNLIHSNDLLKSRTSNLIQNVTSKTVTELS